MLENAIKEDPADEIRVGTLADLYRRIGYDALHRNQTAQARAYFNAALTNIDQEVKIITAHHTGEDDAGLAATLLKRAETGSDAGVFERGRYNARQDSHRSNPITRRLC